MKPNNLLDRLQIRPWFTNVILSLLGLALLGFTRQLIIEFHHFSIGFSGVAGWSVCLYALAAATILLLPTNRFTLFLVLAFAIAFRLVTLPSAPFMSSDIYRYVWDGIVQHAHISPYRYVPGDPALTFLRAPHQNIYDHINRRNYAHTIYPPFAQFLFYVITSFSASVTCMKVAMVLFEGVTIYALMQLLQALGRRREEVLLYAWCPLLIWEFGSSGHLDSAAMAFIALALLARFRRQSIAVGLFLGAAVLIKFYPLVLFPALWQRKDFKLPLVLAAFAAVAYACYASVGKLVFGFLGGYVSEEGMETGSRYFFLQLIHRLPGLHNASVALYVVVLALLFGALAFLSWKAGNPNRPQPQANFWSRTFRLPPQANFLPGVLFIAFAMMLAFSPHYPWYVAWLIPLGVLLPNLPVFIYTLGLFYLSSTALGAGTTASQFRLNCILYAAVLLAALLEGTIRIWLDRRHSDIANAAVLPQ